MTATGSRTERVMLRGKRDARALVAGAGVLMVAACATDPQSPLPDGQAGYIAVEQALEAAPIGPYRVRAGDVVSVNVYGEDELSDDAVTLDATGNIRLPLVGDLQAAGLTADELGDAITTAYASRYLRDPVVSVSVKQSQALQITVEGEVEQPGSFAYAEGQTLLTALAMARSPTSIAALRDVAVFRTVEGQRFGGRFDIRAIRAGQMPDLALAPGDLVVVGQSSRRIAMQRLFGSLPVLGALAPI